jgi:hypothetical protein
LTSTVQTGKALRLMIGLAAATIAVSLPLYAEASRAPEQVELKAIRRAAMIDCNRHQNVPGYDCRWRGDVKISTIDPRYAWAEVMGPAYDHSGILRRRSKHAQRWRVVRVVGGGIQPCSYWYAKAPRAVVREFGLRGYRENSGSFDYHPC